MSTPPRSHTTAEMARGSRRSIAAETSGSDAAILPPSAPLRVGTRCDGPDRERWRRLLDFADPPDLVLEAAPLRRRQAFERLDRHGDSPAGPSLVPDPDDRPVDDEDGHVAGLRPGEGSLQSATREHAFPGMG